VSTATFQQEILAAARRALRNPKLKMSDIHEWAIGEVNPCQGEVVVSLTSVRCNICISKDADKRVARG
jgi:hypothetical protein